jgi:hypothetical protein
VPILKGSVFRPGDIKHHAGLPSQIPAGWAVADHRIANIADFPGLYAAIGQRWELGTDTYDTGLQFRFPDGTRLLRGAESSTPFSAVAGAPVIAGLAVTVTANDRAATALQSGKKYFYVTLAGAVPPASAVFACGFSTASGLQTVGLSVSSAGTVIASHSSGGATVGPYVSGETWAVYRDSVTGTWGVIKPDGTDTGALAGGFVGATQVVAVAAQAGATPATGTLTFATSGAFVFPADYSAANLTAYNVGTRAGSTTSGGTALTVEQMPPHSHNYASIIDATTAAGADFDAINNGANGSTTTETGAGEAHSHSLDPEHVKMLVLVKL